MADLLRPVEEGFFEAIPVSDLVNKVANSGPEIQERFVASPDDLAAEQASAKPARKKPGGDDADQMSLF